MPILARFLFALVLTTAVFNSAEADDPLPAMVEVSFEVHNLREDLPADLQQDLAEKLRDTLRREIRRRIGEHWTISGQPSRYVFHLLAEQYPGETRPYFILTIKGLQTHRVEAPAPMDVGNPSDGADFVRDMHHSTVGFLRENFGEVRRLSAMLHQAATVARGAPTTVRIQMEPMSEEELRDYDPSDISIIWEHRPEAHFAHAESQGQPFEDAVYLAPGEARRAKVRRLTRTALLDAPVAANLCLYRNRSDDTSDPAVNYECPSEGDCTLRTAQPPDWATQDCESGRTGWLLDLLTPVARAHAQIGTREEIWSAPSLPRLVRNLRDGVSLSPGYAEFVISSESVADLDADAYRYAIKANGVPVWIDGIPPDSAVRGFEPSDGLTFRFALENLQFAGRESGCEILEVSFDFLKGEKETGKSVTLIRPYAALRDAPPITFEEHDEVFQWRGIYHPPVDVDEFGIFVGGLRFERGDRERMREVIRALNGDREAVDGLGWSVPASALAGGLGFASKQLPADRLEIVGKVRPPLSPRPHAPNTFGYGLAIGVKLPSGQMQFTFDRRQTETLVGLLLERRAAGSALAKRLIPAKREHFYIYPYTQERRERAPDWVCASLADIGL